ncbi:DUF6458 family protein [Dactylosporangium sucinum]|uniref:DUF6458 domain-containing protein n=1 Tax=Dactylosporangium sucinum TaxID=1424081 RepID=A0A917X145_9ACTN|nr:DUF6458 family protein [Dactylosporangium sucinum]GGM51230.1 hypothetical protein GCM10007977_061270 [Dactylosporangium sucinum]
MGIGGSILLIVVGAIFTFGLDDTDLGPFNLDTIGWILQLAGVVALLLTLYFWNSRRRTVVREVPTAGHTVIPPTTDEVIERRERRY